MRTDKRSESGAGQRRAYYGAASVTAERWRAFMEIQQSGNPLSEDEVRQLMAKRPGVYGFLKAYAGG